MLINKSFLNRFKYSVVNFVSRGDIINIDNVIKSYKFINSIDKDMIICHCALYDEDVNSYNIEKLYNTLKRYSDKYLTIVLDDFSEHYIITDGVKQ